MLKLIFKKAWEIQNFQALPFALVEDFSKNFLN
jgi:hypothetical protein